MTTQNKSAFKGVTQLRTALHGPLLLAQTEKDSIEFHLAQLVFCAELEDYPIYFEATLEKYHVQGEAERAFLLDLAVNPGWADIFLWTVIAASWGKAPGEALCLADLQSGLVHVKTTMRQNGLVSTKGIPSTPRKGWVLLNVFERPLKRFEWGMGGEHHVR
jgi:hypothetical protein